MRNEKGFVLPLAILLVMVLGISGTSFMHLDYLERRMAMNEVDHHGAFYLANAGMERARSTLKVSTSGVPNWTPILTGSVPNFVNQNPPHPRLCPPQVFRGCVILPFQTTANTTVPIVSDGDPVTSPDFPFLAAEFDNGSYEVRAFDNIEPPCPAPSTADCDGIIFVRALGTVRGQEKLLEAQLQSTSALHLINCDEQVQPSPACPAINGNPTITHLEGKDPASLPPALIPVFEPSFYTNVVNFPNNAFQGEYTGGALVNNSYYFNSGDVDLQSLPPADNVVIYSEGVVDINNATLTNSIVIGLGGVEMHGNVTITAPLPYPAVVSGGTVGADTQVNIVGTIYATGPITLGGGASVTGILIASGIVSLISLNGNPEVTDGGNPEAYALMPGFTYDPETIKTVIVDDTWVEIE